MNRARLVLWLLLLLPPPPEPVALAGAPLDWVPLPVIALLETRMSLAPWRRPRRAPMHFTSLQYSGQQAGTRLIVTGAVHGNETCGTKAIQRVMQELDTGALLIRHGSVTFVPVTNPLAYAKGERAGERADLRINLARSRVGEGVPARLRPLHLHGGRAFRKSAGRAHHKAR